MSSRTGVVWIAVDVDPQDLVVFTGYWDSGSAVLDEMPNMSSAVEAIRWGLDRTDDIRIRFDNHNYWWAGIGTMPDDPDGIFAGTVALRR